jgi:Rhodanese-like domain
MKDNLSKILVSLPIFLFLGLFAQGVVAGDVPRMTKEELKSLMDNAQVFIIDVRTDSDWNGSTSKIKGALREKPRAAESWADKYDKSKTYVLYCA